MNVLFKRPQHLQPSSSLCSNNSPPPSEPPREATSIEICVTGCHVEGCRKNFLTMYHLSQIREQCDGRLLIYTDGSCHTLTSHARPAIYIRLMIVSFRESDGAPSTQTELVIITALAAVSDPTSA